MKSPVSIVSTLVGLFVTSLLVQCTQADTQSVFSDTEFGKARNYTNTLLGRLADSKVIGGAALVQKDGKLAFAKGFGTACEELDVKVQDDYIFPIGSNTKFFTAVAIYQLQEKGLLNVTDAVNSYVEPGDFGLALPWCPKIHDKEQLGCQEPTIKQLLQMSSGLLPVDNLGCGMPNSTWSDSDWFWQYRSFDWDLNWGEAMGYTGNWLSGNATHADLLKFQKLFDQPLLHAPGSQYCYVNANFQLAGYIVEKVTNMSFGSYLMENIIKPANLSNTFYWTGAPGWEPEGLHRRSVSLPAYRTTFEGSSGPAAYKKINRYPWFPGQSSTAAQAAGSLSSNTHDLLRFYNLILTQPEVIGLSNQSVSNLTEPLQPIPGVNASFAQGIAVSNSTGNGKKLACTGEIWGFETQITMWVNPSNPSKSDAVVFFSNLSPAIPFSADGSCSVLSPRDGSRVDLDSRACGNSNGAGMTNILTDQLAKIWGISGKFGSS